MVLNAPASQKLVFQIGGSAVADFQLGRINLAHDGGNPSIIEVWSGQGLWIDDGNLFFKASDGVIDTSAGTAGTQLKIKAANAFTVNDGTTDLIDLSASGLKLTAIGATVNEFSTDDTLAGDSDTAVPTEKAVKGYVDAQVAGEDLWDLTGEALSPKDVSNHTLDFTGATGSDISIDVPSGQDFQVKVAGNTIATLNWGFLGIADGGNPSTIGWASGQELRLNDGNDVLKVSYIDGGGVVGNGTVLEFNHYASADQPALTANGQLTLWEDTDDSNRSYLIVRTNAGDKKVELT